MTQPAPYPPAAPASPPPQPRNGLGTTGFVLGLVGLVLAPIPLVGVVAWPLVILGLIFAAIGYTRVRKGQATNKGLSIAGIVTSLAGLVLCIVWAAMIGKVVSDVSNQVNQVSTITYDVTGSAGNVDIDYTTFGTTTNDNKETAPTLPWRKVVRTKGLVTGGSLIVTTGADGGSATCKVTVNGKETKTETATGPFAVASCSNF